MSRYPKSLLSGFAGAAVVTLLNESVRRYYRKAPRLEQLGMDAGSQILDAAGIENPGREPMYWSTMAADLISNALYYSLIGLAYRRKPLMWLLGLGMGAAAGAGAVLLPKPLELDESTTTRTPQTRAMTVAWYLGGAMVATAIASSLLRNDKAGKQQ